MFQLCPYIVSVNDGISQIMTIIAGDFKFTYTYTYI